MSLSCMTWQELVARLWKHSHGRSSGVLMSKEHVVPMFAVTSSS